MKRDYLYINKQVNSLGYFVLVLILGLLVFFFFRNSRQFLSGINPDQVEGFYLLTDKYYVGKEQTYYGVFQQGDKQMTGRLSASLYLSLQVPQRGYLHMKEGQVIKFQ